MNKKNKAVMNLLQRYKYIKHFSKGLIQVNHGRQIGIFSIEKNDFIVPLTECDNISRINNDLFLMTKECPDLCNKKRGIFSTKTNTFALSISFDHISDRGKGLYLVGRGDWLSLFSLKDESFVVPTAYSPERLTTTLFVVRLHYTYKRGVFCTNSNSLIVPLEYDNVDYISDTLFAVTTKDDPDKTGIFSTESNALIKLQYFRIKRLHGSYFIITSRSLENGLFCSKTRPMGQHEHYDRLRTQRRH